MLRAPHPLGHNFSNVLVSRMGWGHNFTDCVCLELMSNLAPISVQMSEDGSLIGLREVGRFVEWTSGRGLVWLFRPPLC